MLINQFLQKRKSVRDFRGGSISKRDLKQIDNILNEINKEIEDEAIRFEFFDGSIYDKLEGEAGYGGQMIKAPGYIGLIYEYENSLFRGAYYFEDIIGKIFDMGLGSCWISLDGLKDKSVVSNAEYLLAIGYPANIMSLAQDTFSSRLGVEDIVFSGKLGQPTTMEELAARGLDEVFSHVRFVPSQYNEQPWRYVLTPDSIDMYIERKEEERNYMADAGIAAYYLEALLKRMNIPCTFADKNNPNEGAYEYIASICI